jgi:hypothetical protein
LDLYKLVSGENRWEAVELWGRNDHRVIEHRVIEHRVIEMRSLYNGFTSYDKAKGHAKFI